MPITRTNTVHLLCLELASITPILIILGNIAPAFPIKVHHAGLGLLFLLSVIALAADAYKKWILYFALVLIMVQFTMETFSIKGIVDYFFGPFILILFVDILVNKKLYKATLLKYLRRFYVLLWVPAIIAVFQYFDIVPITFWKATYINYAYFGELAIARPNGLLYHGSELSVIITFLALFQFFKKGSKAVFTLLIIVAIAAATYFKALFGCVLLIFFYYLFFVNRVNVQQLRLMSRKRLLFFGFLSAGVISFIAIRFFMTVHFYTGYYFPRTMLTGRGAIWNIYLERIKEFTWWNYLFGNGIGSSFDIFANYATADTWYMLESDPDTDLNYDTHNAVLSVFINSGIVGLAFFSYLFKIIFNQVKKWQGGNKWNKTVFFGIFILPLITIGITIPIYENAIFWTSLGFLIFKWKLYTDDTTADKEQG